MAFRGSFVPLITPFNQQGAVDYKILEEFVTWHIASGSDGIICSATTGEGTCLSERERTQVTKVCVQIAGGRIPILASTGTSDT